MKILITLMLFISFKAIADRKMGIDRRAAEKIMKLHLKKFRKCYAAEIKTDPLYREGVVIRWEIASTGKVENSAVTNSTTNNPKLHSCLLDTLQTLKFDLREDAALTRMIYPMILSGNNCED